MDIRGIRISDRGIAEPRSWVWLNMHLVPNGLIDCEYYSEVVLYTNLFTLGVF